MREVGHTIPIGTWWLNLARQVVNADARDFQTLGADLAKHVNRATPFDKAMLSRLVSGKSSAVTIELVDALCAEYRTLPRPIYIARSYGEAAHLSLAVDDYERTVGAEINEEAALVSLPNRKRRSKPTAATKPQATGTRRTGTR